MTSQQAIECLRALANKLGNETLPNEDVIDLAQCIMAIHAIPAATESKAEGGRPGAAPNEPTCEKRGDSYGAPEHNAAVWGSHPFQANAEPPQPSVQGQQDDDEIQDVLIDVWSDENNN